MLSPGDPSKKLNPMLVKDDYERLKMIRKTKIDKKRFDVSIILKKRGRKTKN